MGVDDLACFDGPDIALALDDGENGTLGASQFGPVPGRRGASSLLGRDLPAADLKLGRPFVGLHADPQ